MSGSLRSQLWLSSVLWTVGLVLVVAILAVVLLGHNPRPHMMILRWFVAVPAGVTVAIGVGCMAVGALLLRRSLTAVDQIGARIADVHRGVGRRITGEYPSEVQPLVHALNALLAERDERVARAMATAGDLAHGLKTPLAVLARDAERAAAGGDDDLSASLRAQIERMRRQIDYHLAHARATAAGRLPGVRTGVGPSVAGLLRTVARLYAERALAFEQSVPDTHAVRCPREDLEEILGNLLDNASKWARTWVRVSSAVANDLVSISVEDDGPGLDPALASAVWQRGVRADERVPGFGLGLSIARDLVELYGGSIELSRSSRGGLRVGVCLPSAAPGEAA